MTPPQTLFVYGTLRRDAGQAVHHLLARHGTFVGEATVRGRLFDLGSYPGMTLDGDRGVVLGELYEITSDWPAFIARLDAYEGCAEDDPEPHQYRRELVTALRASGPPVDAWAYVLNVDPTGWPRIASGDYESRNS
ncbi:MAG TPA: gamma-glutamylcyclotransferase family protein [Thermoanaerobaculia bacterium]|nr:gamma-glutamylcyclotransferase family protein [Thermoanaerobaculia bacterium]